MVLALSIQQVARGVPVVRRRYVLEAAISEVALPGAIPPAARCGATVCGTVWSDCLRILTVRGSPEKAVAAVCVSPTSSCPHEPRPWQGPNWWHARAATA